MQTDWPSFIDWVVKGILGWICMHGVHVLSEMKKSIDLLNEKVATMIERTHWHSEEIARLENRIIRLEERRANGS